MTDFFASPSAQRLEKANADLAAALDGESAAPAVRTPSRAATLDDATVAQFDDAATRHNVPVDVRLGMAERDSGFDPYARSRGRAGS